MVKKTDVHNMVETVESSPVFSKFNSENPTHYLAHAFAAIQGLNSLGPLEFGYYGKDADRITVFKTAPIEALPPEEVFKEEGIVDGLDLAEVTVGLSDLSATLTKLHASEYSHHPVIQVFCVLQYNKDYGVPLWNATVVFTTLHMLNVKVDAISGRILSHDLQNLMNLKAN